MFKNFSIKTKKFLIFSFLIISFFAFIFFGFSKTYSPAYAISPEGADDIHGGDIPSVNSFSIVDGLSFRLDDDIYLGRVIVNITPDMYSKLITDGGSYSSGFWFLEREYILRSKYYLRLSCSSNTSSILNNSSSADIFVKYYSCHPLDSFLLSTGLSFSNDHTQAYLNFELPLPYSSEFYYYVDFVSTYLGDGGDTAFERYYDLSNVHKYRYHDVVLFSRTENYTKRSISNVASSILNDSTIFSILNENQLRSLNFLAGNLISDSTFTVNLHYKYCVPNSSLISDCVLQYNVNSFYALTPSGVFSSLKNLVGFDDLTYFDVLFENIKTYDDGVVKNLDNRILLQSISYTYSYNSTTNTGDFYIVYSDFWYKDFFIQLTDNNLADGIDLNMYIFATDVSFDDGDCIISFDFADISSVAYSSLSWIFTLDEDSFTIVDNAPHINTSFGNGVLYVIIHGDYQSELINLSILANAEIVPDFECTVNILYKEIDFVNSSIEYIDRQESLSLLFSEYKLRFGYPLSFINFYSDLINDVLYLEEYPNLDICSFESINCIESSDSNVFDVEVIYSYNTLLKIVNTLNSDISFYNFTGNSLMYDFSDFDYSIPSGYRISNLTCSNNDLSINFEEYYPLQSEIVVNTSVHLDKIIVLTANLSDKWPVKINYLSRYKNSPFAELKTFESEINVSDYGNLEELTGDDIENIIGESNISHLQFNEIPIRIDDDSITVSKSGDLFEFDFGYTKAFIKGKNSDGSSDFYEIALTPFSIWSSSFGSDWSIQSLNTKDFKFTYSNEVAKDKLYGFFTVMTFKSQVSDFDSWFTEYTSSGCCSFFNSKEVRGNGLYRFLANNESLLTIAGGTVGFLFGHSIAGAVAGAALQFGVMSASEFLNDENGIYYSYFLYLDGTTDMPYASNFGADDYYDTDSGFKNFFQDVKDDVLDFLDDSGISKVFKILLGIIIALIILWGIFELISLIVKFIRKIKPSDDGKKNKKGG